MTGNTLEIFTILGTFILVLGWTIAIISFITITMSWVLFKGLLILTPATYFYWKYSKAYWEK